MTDHSACPIHPGIPIHDARCFLCELAEVLSVRVALFDVPYLHALMQEHGFEMDVARTFAVLVFRERKPLAKVNRETPPTSTAETETA